MAQYRKFWLINSLGNRYDFTSKNSKIFLDQPQGFGFVRNYEVKQIGNSELLTSYHFALTNITGELLFYGNSNGTIYQDYQNFIQFAKFKPLEFHYQTPNDLGDYYSEVLFIQTDKTQIREDGILHCPVAFHRLTEWLTSKDYVITLRNTPTDEGKNYPLVRPYHYAGNALSDTPITNNGTDDVGFVITIDGECENPIFTLTQEGDMYGVCKINGTYDYIQVNSVEKDETIYLERNGSVIANPEAYQDFSVANGNSYITWCKFRVGQSTFNFTCGNIDTFDGTITISFKNSYVSV